MAAKTQFFSIYINTPMQLSIKPIRQQVLNELDLIGEQEGLKRLPGESNANYKQRLMDIEVHPGGPTYEGIINNLSRAFNLLRKTCLTISLKTNSTGGIIADSPRVDILADRIILYSDWRPTGVEEIDRVIYFNTSSDTGYFLGDLIDQINMSTFFQATAENDVRLNMHSSNLIRTSSSKFIRNDIISDNKRTDLSANLITRDSLVFDETNIFKTEVLVEPSSVGEFFVDYERGIVESYSIPSGTRVVSYYYAAFPLVVDYSLIKVYDLFDDVYYDTLFIKETSDSGQETKTLLNTKGTEILQYMFNELPVFWGK